MSKIGRRLFLALTGAGAAAAGAAGRRLVPNVLEGPDRNPGLWSTYVTTCRECPAGCGLHVSFRDGRVTKAEGNPDHPVNRGGLCPRGQSALQGLYDPDRLQKPLLRSTGRLGPVEYDPAIKAAAAAIAGRKGNLLLVSGIENGVMNRVLKRAANELKGQLLYYEPFNYETLRSAHQRLFGQPVIPRYDLASRDFILSLSADFLESWLSPVEFARAFSEMHAPAGGTMGALVYVGPRLSMTAANADLYLPVRPGDERWVGLHVLRKLIENGRSSNLGDTATSLGPVLAGLPPLDKIGVSARTIGLIADRFAGGRAVALAGPVGATGAMAEEAAIAAGILNLTVRPADGAPAVDFSRPHALSTAATQAEATAAFEQLGKNDVLLVINANPAYSLPAAAAAVGRAGTTIVIGTMPDETAEAATIVLPAASWLESFGDYEPWAGLRAAQQPVMQNPAGLPATGDIVLDLARRAGSRVFCEGDTCLDFQAVMVDEWRLLQADAAAGGDFEAFWLDALRRGGVWIEPPPVTVNLPADLAALKFTPSASPADGALDLVAFPTIMLHDGRVANRGWLQEAPEPVSYISWGDWVELHPETAAKLGVAEGEVVTLSAGTATVEAPARLVAEMAPGAAAIPFGYGHTALGCNARGRGGNAFTLSTVARGAGHSVTAKAAGRHEPPVNSSASREQFHREIIRWVSLPEADRAADAEEIRLPLPEGYSREQDLYPPHYYPAHRWAMAIDLHRCIGCGACAVACYAENNLAVVGPVQMRRGLEMAWLKVPPYQRDGGRRLGWLPLACQHCDSAPCEPVCPVYAAVHNQEGLNAQVYNRCVGTRYCANNCPYKVRRFNWFDPKFPEPLTWQLNPEVTVRMRGVMEKCTFCIQRIKQAEYQARLENRPLHDGEIVPACAQSCPTAAFTFGDLMDEHSRISEIFRRHPRRYQLLPGLNTKPAVIYLRRIDAGLGGDA